MRRLAGPAIALAVAGLLTVPVVQASAATCGTTNAALHHTATASSTQDTAFPASSAVDGDPGTRWSSEAGDPQWIEVDLGASRDVCGVGLTWESAYATAYDVQLSTDGTTWNTVYHTDSGAGGTEHPAVAGTGRYLRVHTTARATQWGVSLWELTVNVTEQGSDPGGCPWVGSTAPVADRVAQLMAAMTPQQKVVVLHGNGNASPYIGNSDAIPELCVPALGLQDGPAGVGDSLDDVTELPDPTSVAASWDTGLAGRYGTVMGEEFKGKGANVVLGPTINIVRDPRWGRAFESYSEDPYLTGQTGVATVTGIQSQGVLAQVKHAAAYNVETYRGSTNVVVDDKALHEIYLPAFQAAATQGHAASFMCAYNKINGTPACQSNAVLDDSLKQLGWNGFVGPDWGAATGGPAQLANGGLDQEMPGGAFFGQGLLDAVDRGEVTQARVDDMVRRVLTQMFTFGLFDHGPTGTPTADVTSAAHTTLARDVAAQGAVLLKNDGGALPLDGSVTSIALLGGDAIDPQNIGGGSAKVNPSPHAVNPIDGITARAGAGTHVQWVAGAGEHVDNPDIPAAVALAQQSDVAVVFASYGEGEASDLTSIDLQHSQNELIEAVAAANPRTVVVLNTGSAVTMPWLGDVEAVVEGWYPGQENGNAIAALLYGDVNPSGKLPVTFPKSLADVPASTPAQFPGTADHVDYSEGVQVGYRWYDARGVEPLFPFGFGLSYTTFAFSGLQITPDGANTTVTATVTNTGPRAGAEVAQLYIGHPASAGEPPKQLRGYQKVTLQPGASTQVHFTVTPADLSHWDGGWVTDPGQYQVSVGNSSRALPLTGTITVG